ncbi:Mechanosensitive ion channel-domain-containing protein [Peziza echinospora]|nr:Mechanosensitive ion channel-domain-containing protein [Peziza echinospora]
MSAQNNDPQEKLNAEALPSTSEKDTAARIPHPLQIPSYDGSFVPQRSASHAREQQHRFIDELELQRAERVATHASKVGPIPSRMKSTKNIPTLELEEREDEFEVSTNPVHKTSAGVWTPPSKPKTKLAQFLKMVHGSSVLVRYFTYIVPVGLILVIPILLAALVFKSSHVGNVKLLWFCVWLMIVWLSLWAGRILAKTLPFIVGIIASVLSNSAKKWKDMARMLELPAALFFWWLAVFISFIPTMTNHHLNGDNTVRYWENRMQVVLIAIFVGMVLNFIEKIIIQLIAISFHQRTYEDRIVLNKFQISSLAKLYSYSRAKLTHYTDEDTSGPSEGTRTHFGAIRRAGAGAQRGLTMVGDAIGKVAGDFTGKKNVSSAAPHRVVVTLLQTTDGCQALARRLYRTFITPDKENISAQDLRAGFSNDDESDAAFQMFDRDLNGDISCEEMELSIVEIGRERKAITASLKDLDTVISKLDNVFTVIVIIITVIVFLSIISTSTASLISSASGTVLALSWLFSGTAQEFLASIIFVFVKHPFDVGDRIDILNTSAGIAGSFYVKEIALMYTEFRKPTGQVVQAPNSLLNTLFILNMRRSGALAEAITVYIKFGTTIDQIDDLRIRMLDFVKSENREYQGKVLTELIDIPNMHSIKLNVVFFYKSNWQNELLRLSRRNKFMCALMVNLSAVGIESPNMRWPGQRATAPMFLTTLAPPQLSTETQLPPGFRDTSNTDFGNRPMGPDPYLTPYNPQPQSQYQDNTSEVLRDESNSSTSNPNMARNPSIVRHHTSESTGTFSNSPTIGNAGHSFGSAMKKQDYSLGLSSEFLLDDSADVFEDRRRHNNPGMLSAQALDRVREEVEDDINPPLHHTDPDTAMPKGSSTTSSIFSGGFKIGSRRRRANSNAASIGSHSIHSHNTTVPIYSMPSVDRDHEYDMELGQSMSESRSFLPTTLPPSSHLGPLPPPPPPPSRAPQSPANSASSRWMPHIGGGGGRPRSNSTETSSLQSAHLMSATSMGLHPWHSVHHAPSTPHNSIVLPPHPPMAGASSVGSPGSVATITTSGGGGGGNGAAFTPVNSENNVYHDAMSSREGGGGGGKRDGSHEDLIAAPSTTTRAEGSSLHHNRNDLHSDHGMGMGMHSRGRLP